MLIHKANLKVETCPFILSVYHSKYFRCIMYSTLFCHNYTVFGGRTKCPISACCYEGTLNSFVTLKVFLKSQCWLFWIKQEQGENLPV